MESLSVGVFAALVGLGGGIILGLAARLGDFCTLGAIESAFYGNSQSRLRMWGVAIGVAVGIARLTFSPCPAGSPG